MDPITRRLGLHLAVPLRRRYTIFTGTNSLREWRRQARRLLFGDEPAEAGAARVTEYERCFAKHCGVTHATSFGAGRMALYAVLEALGVDEGDEVIIPAFTCVVVPNAIIYRKARPVFVDIEPRTFNIDVAKVEAAITPRTKALYAQHTFGVPCDVRALRTIGQRHGLPVIEDAAHALGAEYEGRPVGSLTEISFFSTDHSKVINTHLGGMAATSDDRLAARLKEIQSRAGRLNARQSRRLVASFVIEYMLFSPRVLWIGRLLQALLARLGVLFYFQDELHISKPTAYPYPCRLSAAQAELGLSQLEDLGRNLAHRRRLAGWLEQHIGWTGMSPREINQSTWLRYSFLVKDRARFESLFGRRFDLGIWFTSVVSGRSADLHQVGYIKGCCPVAEHVVQHVVNFPTHLKIPLETIQEEVSRNWDPMEKEQLPRI